MVVAFYFAVGLRVISGGNDVSYAYHPKVLTKPPGEISSTIVGKKHRPVVHRHIIHAGKVHYLLDDIY